MYLKGAETILKAKIGDNPPAKKVSIDLFRDMMIPIKTNEPLRKNISPESFRLFILGTYKPIHRPPQRNRLGICF